MFRLRTVRAKLLSLVALSIVVTLVTLPLLSWLLHKQLLEEVDDRVENSERGYQSELDDDLVDLELAATLLANDSDVTRAIAAGDAKTLDDVSGAFVKLYPDIDIVFLKNDGTVLASVGCQEGAETIAEHRVVKEVLAGNATSGLSSRGCDREPMPTYFIARPIGHEGALVVGLDFSIANLERARTKLGVDFVLVDPDGKIVHKTTGFPAGGENVRSATPRLIEIDSRSFVLGPFSPKQLEAKKGKFVLVAALDVTQLRSAIRQNLLLAIAVVLVAAIVAMVVGVRVASKMSRALKRVSDAIKKLEQNDYVQVVGVETHDEIELLAKGFNTMVVGLEERDKLKTTFGKYMTAAVMEHLLAGKVQLGGEALTATILFSDIRSFTSISEKMDAKSLVGLLNEYFTEMVDAVMTEDGVVDKYIGDAIMAVFGAPVSKTDDALHAVRAAIGMRDALAELNVRLEKRGLHPLKTGIGIHTGEVIAGNIGSERRMEYTVIGDTVNLASRLETATKELSVSLLISDTTYALVKDHVDARPVKEITVKGRDKPVMTYEVLGLK